MSGHGTTRGEAGLLEMTQLKAIMTTRRWFKPHLQSPTSADAQVLEQLIRIEHAGKPAEIVVGCAKDDQGHDRTDEDQTKSAKDSVQARNR